MHHDKVFAAIKSSASLSLGVIEHSNFSGCLFRIPRCQLREVLLSDDLTYTTIALRTLVAAVTGISWPFSSFAFLILNTERTDEATMKSVASTK